MPLTSSISSSSTSPWRATLRALSVLANVRPYPARPYATFGQFWHLLFMVVLKRCVVVTCVTAKDVEPFTGGISSISCAGTRGPSHLNQHELHDHLSI